MRIGKHSSTWLVGGVLALAVPFCLAQTNPQQSQMPQQGQASSQPSHSAMSANQRAADLLNTVNKDEIDTAQMMQDHTQNTAVKDFAQTLVNDHKDAQQKLETAAGQSNINLQENKSMQNQDSKLKDRLQNENGAASDKAFVNSEIRDHRTAIRELKRLEPQITDPGLKDVVQNAIPVMQKHLDAAQKLQSQLGGKSSGK